MDGTEVACNQLVKVETQKQVTFANDPSDEPKCGNSSTGKAINLTNKIIYFGMAIVFSISKTKIVIFS